PHPVSGAARSCGSPRSSRTSDTRASAAHSDRRAGTQHSVGGVGLLTALVCRSSGVRRAELFGEFVFGRGFAELFGEFTVGVAELFREVGLVELLGEDLLGLPERLGLDRVAEATEDPVRLGTERVVV